jgi:hypothetical protein
MNDDAMKHQPTHRQTDQNFFRKKSENIFAQQVCAGGGTRFG